MEKVIVTVLMNVVKVMVVVMVEKVMVIVVMNVVKVMMVVIVVMVVRKETLRS